jgi:hypothetical protein
VKLLQDFNCIVSIRRTSRVASSKFCSAVEAFKRGKTLTLKLGCKQQSQDRNKISSDNLEQVSIIARLQLPVDTHPSATKGDRYGAEMEKWIHCYSLLKIDPDDLID